MIPQSYRLWVAEDTETNESGYVQAGYVIGWHLPKPLDQVSDLGIADAVAEPIVVYTDVNGLAYWTGTPGSKNLFYGDTRAEVVAAATQHLEVQEVRARRKQAVLALDPLDADALRPFWAAAVAGTARDSKRAAELLRNTTVEDLVGDVLVLGVDTAEQASEIAGWAPVVGQALRDELGVRWQVQAVVVGAGPGVNAAAGPAPTDNP